MTKKLLLLGAALWTWAASAEGWPRSFFRHEQFRLPLEVQPHDVDKIIYGNSAYGFFSLPALITGRVLNFDFFPPGYKKPIEFSVKLKSSGRLLILGKKQYSSPFVGSLVDPRAQFQGRFSPPFFTMMWYTGVNQPTPTVFNREGEVVWALDPLRVDRKIVPPRAYVPLKIGPDQLLVLGSFKAMSYWLVNTKTGVGTAVQAAKNEILHHVYGYYPQSHEIVGLTYDCQKVSYWQENSPVFSGLKGLWNFLRLPRRTAASSKIVRINLSTGESREIWRSSQDFSFANNPSLSMHVDMDRYRDVHTAAEYLALQKHPEYEKSNYGFSCDSDWTHENSVRFYPGKGYLISIRNLNKVALIGEDGQLKWTLGGEAKDTFFIRADRERFSMQHDAWLIGEDRVLLFDNHYPYRGWTDQRFFGQSRVAQYRFGNGAAIREWDFLLPEPRVDIRGSVEPLKNGNLLAYDSGERGRALRFFEIESSSRAAVAALHIDYSHNYRPIEARPIESIAGETFLPDMSSSLKLPKLAFDALAEEVNSGY